MDINLVLCFCFVSLFHDRELVFETAEEVAYGYRLSIETLCPGIYIEASVVDIWSHLLNYQETFRRPDALRRKFFPTSVFVCIKFFYNLVFFLLILISDF